MRAIYKREMNAYFKSPIAVVFLSIYYLFSGMFFYMSLGSGIADLASVFSQMFFFVMFIMPILTMRLLSEDKRQKTDQALLTSPVSVPRIVLGKYLAACTIFALGLAINIVYGVVMSFYASPDWLPLFGNILGQFLLGSSVISIGLFISSLTESQLIAAISTAAVSFLIILIDSVTGYIQGGIVPDLMNSLSFYMRYLVFTSGIIDIASPIFFLSVITIFIFLTVRMIDKRRWS